MFAIRHNNTYITNVLLLATIFVWEFMKALLILVLFLLSNVAYAGKSSYVTAHTPNMPDYDKVGRVPTLNKMGWMHPVIDSVTQQFLDKCAKKKNAKVLEVGAAYGYASLAALYEGAEVWVNDLEPKHLENFKEGVSEELHSKIHIVPGDFIAPYTINESNFDAILAVRVFAFLTPQQLEAAIDRIYQLLKPGGKIYVVADTPYLKRWKSFLPIYEQKVANGDPYPGFVAENSHLYNPEAKNHVTSQLHFLNPVVLKREFLKRKFSIEFCDYMNRTDYPEHNRLDGRETVGLIATKSK
jgi:SAM-dependent methyltransferase